jgi:2-polyprenyl-3-methyl-5-hydroxy-6-metoxy-1,4-benzoquinol methylase
MIKVKSGNNIDPFDVDSIRHQMAIQGKFMGLSESYSGKYPELPEISTSLKWGKLLSEYEIIPEVRIQRLERVVELLDLSKKVLDVGVGWGDIVPLILRKNPMADYTGIDFSNEVIDNLKKKYPSQKFHATTLDKMDGTYDYILVLEVLEHIIPSKVASFYDDIKSRLRNDGLLVFTVPLYEDLKLQTLICGKCGSLVNRMGHVRTYTPTLIKAELNLFVFTVEQLEFVYEGYYGVLGTIRRHLRDLAGRILGPSNYQKLKPTNAILTCREGKQ